MAGWQPLREPEGGLVRWSALSLNRECVSRWWVELFLFIFFGLLNELRVAMFPLLLGLVLLGSTVNSQQSNPRIISWSNETYGPDGPWHAIKATVGGQELDLLPGGSWMSSILATSVCDDYDGHGLYLMEKCPAYKAGLYDFNASDTAEHNNDLGERSFFEDEEMKDMRGAVRRWIGSGEYVSDVVSLEVRRGTSGVPYAVDLPDHDILMLTKAQEAWGDVAALLHTVSIGKLSLGMPRDYKNWLYQMYAMGESPSNAYSMHVGSPSVGIPPSLVIGGYDTSRVYGPVSKQAYDDDSLPIDLIDIGIGVEEGGSPFPFDNMTGLLRDEFYEPVKGPVQVTVDATQPFLYLSQNTCEAIAEHLPVRYRKEQGIYTWNTFDDNYEPIITSPAYLAFTFRLSSSASENMTIKVPFSLLHLTLESPVEKEPLKYFPCQPREDKRGLWSLGRSFMQSAFVAVKWKSDLAGTMAEDWILAQAPGPNTPKTSSPKPWLEEDEIEVEGITTEWKDTWAGFWTPLPPRAVEDDDTPSTDSGSAGLGSGAIAGIAVGGAAAVLAIIGVLWWMRRRKAGRYQTADAESVGPNELHGNAKPFVEVDGADRYGYKDTTTASGVREVNSSATAAELQAKSRPVELP